MIDSYTYTGTGHELDEEAAWQYIRDGYLLEPCTVLKGRTKFSRAEATLPVDRDKLSIELHQTLVANLDVPAKSRRAVMFSGGFDSMLIALLARECGAQVTAVTIQFDVFNPLTVAGAIEFAKRAGIPHQIIQVNTLDFLSAFEELAGITHEPVLDLDLGVVYAALKKYNPLIAGNVFISGMGADQWFGNEALESRSLAARLDKARVDHDAHQAAAQAHGYGFSFPFLSIPMLALAQCVPAALKKDKKLLRELSADYSIPYQGGRNEVQIPAVMKHIFVKTYGHRAWPSPVSVHGNSSSEDDGTLRKIILGLWLEKTHQI